MKVGEELNVEVQGIVVTKAVITALDADTVTFVIPGTEVVVGIRHSLTDEVPEKTPEVDRVLLDDTEGGTKSTNDTRVVAEPNPYTDNVPEPVSLRTQELDSSAIDDPEPVKEKESA